MGHLRQPQQQQWQRGNGMQQQQWQQQHEGGDEEEKQQLLQQYGGLKQTQTYQQHQIEGMHSFKNVVVQMKGHVSLGRLGVPCWEMAEYIWSQLPQCCEELDFDGTPLMTYARMYQELTALPFGEVHWVVLKLYEQVQGDREQLRPYYRDGTSKVLEAFAAVERKPAILFCCQYWVCALLHNWLRGQELGLVQPCHWQLWLGKASTAIQQQLDGVSAEDGEEQEQEGDSQEEVQLPDEGDIALEGMGLVGEESSAWGELEEAIDQAIWDRVSLMLPPGKVSFPDLVQCSFSICTCA
jgi:hypothetical protein